MKDNLQKAINSCGAAQDVYQAITHDDGKGGTTGMNADEYKELQKLQDITAQLQAFMQTATVA